MTPALLGAFALFAFVSSITPGPNNAMLLASGANFGLRRSVPHMMGVFAGFLTLVAVCGLGLGGLFVAYPILHVILAVVGTIYLLYLAARIAFSSSLSNKTAGARPLRFIEAFAFQAANPKGWVMAIGTVTAYVPAQGYFLNLAIVVALFGVIQMPSISLWTVFGRALRRFLDKERTLRIFNVSMGLLLALSLIPTMIELAILLRR
jgi:threonine/homoserine/homoserine lactone efflux protein